jgi:hypothetical protein
MSQRSIRVVRLIILRDLMITNSLLDADIIRVVLVLVDCAVKTMSIIVRTAVRVDLNIRWGVISHEANVYLRDCWLFLDSLWRVPIDDITVFIVVMMRWMILIPSKDWRLTMLLFVSILDNHWLMKLLEFCYLADSLISSYSLWYALFRLVLLRLLFYWWGN